MTPASRSSCRHPVQGLQPVAGDAVDVAVQVDQTWPDDKSGHVEDRAPDQTIANTGDHAVLDQYVCDHVESRAGIDDTTASQNQSGRFSRHPLRMLYPAPVRTCRNSRIRSEQVVRCDT